MDDNNVSAQPIETVKKSKAWLWVLVIALILIAGLVAYFLSTSKSDEKEKTGKSTNDTANEKVAIGENWQVASSKILANKTSTDTHKLVDGTYRMYQMGQNGIYYSDSSDCLTFGVAKPTGVTEEAGKMISNPAVLQVSVTDWIMIYEMAPIRQPGQQGNTPPSSATQRNLYLATSNDGKSFSKVGTAIDSSLEDNYFASVPDLVKTPDGKIRMYYVSRGDAIGSAISEDSGRTWVRESGFRLQNMAVDPDVLLKTEDGTTSWVMYYSVLDPQKNALYKATSEDGLTWQNETKLFVATTSGAIVDPDVVEVSPTQYVMFIGQSTGGGSAGGEQIDLYRAVLEKSIF